MNGVAPALFPWHLTTVFIFLLPDFGLTGVAELKYIKYKTGDGFLLKYYPDIVESRSAGWLRRSQEESSRVISLDRPGEDERLFL